MVLALKKAPGHSLSPRSLTSWSGMIYQLVSLKEGTGHKLLVFASLWGDSMSVGSTHFYLFYEVSFVGQVSTRDPPVYQLCLRQGAELTVVRTYSVMSDCDHMVYSLAGSSVHGISQARMLEWVAISFSGGSS